MPKPSSLVCFASEFPPGPGGIGNHAWNLSKALVGRGWRLVVITDARAGYEEAERAFDAEQPFVVKRANRRWGRLWAVISRMVLFSGQLAAAERDAGVLVSGKFPLWLGAVIRFIFPRRKYWAVLHGSEVNYKSGWKRYVTRWALGRYDGLIAVSSYTRQLVRTLRPGAEVEVIPNGFDAERLQLFTKINSAFSGEPSLVTVGTVSFRKGQQNVIAALPEIKRHWPWVKYHVLGAPLQQKAMQRLCKELGVEEQVLFCGAVSDEDLVKALRTADVFVMLSEEQKDGDTEGFGIAILEANALGVPAIGSRGCGIEDAVADGFSGKLVDPDNPKQIVAAMKEILTSYEVYRAGAQEWAARFHWDKLVDRYIEVLEQ